MSDNRVFYFSKIFNAKERPVEDENREHRFITATNSNQINVAGRMKHFNRPETHFNQLK